MTARQLVGFVEALIIETHGVEKADELFAFTGEVERERVDPFEIAAIGGEVVLY